MDFTKKEVHQALNFVEGIQFVAKVVDEATRQLEFDHTAFPPTMGEDMKGELDFVIHYYYRQIFNGDLDPDEPLVGAPVFDDPLEELNWKLDNYKPEFVLEVKKTLEVKDARQMNSYAQEMLKFAVEKKPKVEG